MDKSGMTKRVPERILIARTDRLGDVVLSTPVIKFLREKYPRAYIAFMVRPENRDVVANNPYLDEVLLYDKNHYHKSLFKTLVFALGLRKKKFDTAIALHPENRVHIMLFVAGIPVRIGYDRKLGVLLTKRLPHHKQEGLKHEIDYNFELIKELGLDTEGADRRPYMVTSSADKELVDSVLRDHDLKRDMIAVHPGASCPSKRWMPERFAEVAKRLSREYKADIVLVGGDETVEYSRVVASSIGPEARNFTGMLRVGELAELLSRCRVFISNDSGPVHVAVARGTPVVVIFGRKDPGLSPRRWGPVGADSVVLHGDAGCSVCKAHNCEKEFECLKAVTAEDVFKAAEELLER